MLIASHSLYSPRETNEITHGTSSKSIMMYIPSRVHASRRWRQRNRAPFPNGRSRVMKSRGECEHACQVVFASAVPAKKALEAYALEAIKFACQAADIAAEAQLRLVIIVFQTLSGRSYCCSGLHRRTCRGAWCRAACRMGDECVCRWCSCELIGTAPGPVTITDVQIPLC